jgi:hypothetical protein
MTFGYRSISNERKNLFSDPEIDIFDLEDGFIRNNNVICIKNNQLHKYNLKTKELINTKFPIASDWQTAISGKYLNTTQDVGEPMTVYDMDLVIEIPLSNLAALPEHYTAWRMWFMNEFTITSFHEEIQVVAMDGSEYRHTARGTGAYTHWPKTNFMIKIGSADEASWATIHEREWRDLGSYEIMKHSDPNFRFWRGRWPQFVENRYFRGFFVNIRAVI